MERLTLISKGVRKAKNPQLSILQPFHLLDLTFYYKKNRTMHILKEADISMITPILEKIYLAYYLVSYK